MSFKNQLLKIAYDTNTYRSKSFIPFICYYKNDIQIFIPAMIYAEKGYSYLLNGDSFITFNDEIKTYNGKILPFTQEEIEISIQLAHKLRKILPFKLHSRDYLIAGQIQGKIDIFITYNKKHFETFNINSIRILEPEEFMLNFKSILK